MSSPPPNEQRCTVQLDPYNDLSTPTITDSTPTSSLSSSYDPSRPSLPVQLILDLAQCLAADKDTKTLLALQRVSKEGYKVSTPLIYRHVVLDTPERLFRMFQPLIDLAPTLIQMLADPKPPFRIDVHADMDAEMSIELEDLYQSLTSSISSISELEIPANAFPFLPLNITSEELLYPFDWIHNRRRRIVRALSLVKYIQLDFSFLPRTEEVQHKLAVVVSFLTGCPFPTLERIEVSQTCLHGISPVKIGEKNGYYCRTLSHIFSCIKPKHVCIAQASGYEGYDCWTEMVYFQDDGDDYESDGRLEALVGLVTSTETPIESLTIHSHEITQSLTFALSLALRRVIQVRLVMLMEEGYFPVENLRALAVAALMVPEGHMLEICDHRNWCSRSEEEKQAVLERLEEGMVRTARADGVSEGMEVKDGKWHFARVKFLPPQKAGECPTCSNRSW
ncbi:hypothetical protein M231_04133 [Tremella mesenterica]|uniref:Uncharacterized protein n=1 Tax=Tremella mesenterica TaxID=5217 RepID=A0A4V1M3Z9_TREME|nr:hypothetical protein M231_04133 [Tremella mesenterica]